MSRPTREAVTFAFVGQAFADGRGALHGLVPLFAPAVMAMEGKIFEPSIIADQINKTFDLAVSPLVVTSMVPALVASGYLKPAALAGPTAELYRCCSPVVSESQENAGKAVEGVFSSFRAEARQALAIHNIEVTDEELDARLHDSLISTEFLQISLGGENGRFKAGQLTLRKSDQISHGVAKSQALEFLCAEFIQRNLASSSSDFDLLMLASWGALISEVVISIQRPGAAGDFSRLTVVLDGPLILDALGAGEELAAHYAKDLIDLLKRAGVRIGVFSHTLEEMREVLQKPLSLLDQGYEITGPIAIRYRKEPHHVTFIRALVTALPRRMEELGVTTIESEPFDRDVACPHFSEERVHALRVYIAGERLHLNVQRDLRDARSVGYVFRMRGNRTPSSLSEASCVFVTKNGGLVRSVNRYFAAQKLMGEWGVSACVSDQQIAGVLWFCTGGGGEQLTRLRLAMNCAMAVAPRSELLRSMSSHLLKIDKEKEREFIALIKDDRAAMCLMRETLGVASLATADSVERILVAMKEALGQEERERLEAEYEGRQSQIAGVYEEALRDKERKIEELDRSVLDLRLQSEAEQARYLVEIDREKSAHANVRSEIDRVSRELHKLSVATEQAQGLLRDRIDGEVDFVRRRVQAELVLLYFLLVYLATSSGLSSWLSIFVSSAVTALGFWRMPQFLIEPIVSSVVRRERIRRERQFGGAFAMLMGREAENHD